MGLASPSLSRCEEEASLWASSPDIKASDNAEMQSHCEVKILSYQEVERAVSLFSSI